MPHISAAFDSGNIEVVDASDPNDIQLKIRPDHASEHYQWFHFRAAGVRDVPLTVRILNAGGASYPKAWDGYRAVVSADRETWHRTETGFADGVLTIRVTPESDAVYVAYFAPYSLEQHHDLIAVIAGRTGVRHDVLGTTVDGRDLDRLTVGDGPRPVWVIARQHPGESMAEWWMEGFLDRLTDPDDALARELRSRATVHVVPNMNPDGSVRGHLRTNAAGTNLNRVWHAPTADASPEVLWVRNAMDQTGVHLCLDVHGDEALPYNFISGAEGIPSWRAELATRQARFLRRYESANPDFQQSHGYPVAAPGQANLTMCTNQVAERFGALGMTLEMPFKDNADAPDRVFGWSPIRAAKLGTAAVDPIVADLRDTAD